MSIHMEVSIMDLQELKYQNLQKDSYIINKLAKQK